MKETDTEKTADEKKAKFVEGIDYYFEGGFLVMTEKFLLDRGYCCKNGCRHCPYPKEMPERL
ncbi:MAG: DUF5522 domain-containing protein [Pyrinomonadaceae bacterium]